MTPEDQINLDSRLTNAARNGNTEMVKTLLAANADVHAWADEALCSAAAAGHAETVQALLEAGANVHARGNEALCRAASGVHTETVRTLLIAGADIHDDDDYALWLATYRGDTKIVQLLARHIFAPDSWRAKNRAEIEAEASALYDKIKARDSSDDPIKPEYLRMAGTILLDSALTCWEQVRPAPPKINISQLPAQPRPL